jgi:uroporphyrinogen-III synthase
MKKILFTRLIDTPYQKALRDIGLELIEYDFLKINPLPSAQKDIEIELPFIKNLVFTSQHAIRIFFDSINASSGNFKSFPNFNTAHWAIFSTSEATKNLIESHNLTPTLSAPTAKQLAQLMLDKADLSPGVHFVCGNLSLNHLPDILEKKGISVKKMMVYETVKHPLPILEPFDAVVFLSLSAADAFLEKNTIPSNTQIFTLGETTADHVRKMTDTPSIFVAEKPTISALIDLIRQKCT